MCIQSIVISAYFDSINKIKDMIEYANKLGNQAMAITDHETISSHVKFLKTVEELKKKKEIDENFKPILGNEIYLVDEEQMNYEMEELGRTTFNHFLLLAKNNTGHEQIRKLSTLAWKRMFNYKGIERVPTFYSDIENVVGDNKGHLISSTACLGGRFPSLIMNLIYEEDKNVKENIKDKIDEFICWCIDNFGKEDFYIELQPSLQQEQIDFNIMALKIAKVYGLKWIITTDAHYLKEEDRPIHKAFLTSEDDENNNREIDDFYSTTYFFTVDKLFENMNYLEKGDIELGIVNTKEIADKIEGYSFFGESIIPLIKLPNKSEWYQFNYDLSDYLHIKELYESDEEQHQYLVTQIFKGIEERNISKEKLTEVLDRVDIECKEIIGASKAKKQPMGAYLITMQKNVDIIWEEAESLIGAGRGSANGYIINYLLGITQVNPLKQDVEMPHWRFMSAERPDIFDVDIDFSSHKKDVVLDKITKYYQSIGGDAVRVVTFGTETSKSAALTSCRGLKINNDVALYLSSLVPVERGKVWDINDCYYGNKEKSRKPIVEFKNMVNEYSDKNLLNVMLGIEGLINKRSSHACFSGDTLITTKEGLKEISDIKIGDLVLTHNKRFKPVIDLIKTESDISYRLKTKSSFPLEVTAEHPFLVRERVDKGRKRTFSEPKWKKVNQLTINKDYVGIPINEENIIPHRDNIKLPFDNPNFWWIIGRYIGDGWTEEYDRIKVNTTWKEKRIIICCSKIKKDEHKDIIQRLNSIGVAYRLEEVRTTYKIHIKSNELYNYLQEFGRYAYGKYLNKDIFNLPIDLLKEFLTGYMSADGHYYKDKNKYTMKTISKDLAIGFMQIINKVYKRHASVTILPPKIEYIENRKVYSKEKYEVGFYLDLRTREKSFYENGYIWTKLSAITELHKIRTMYNLTVLDDNSYVAHGLGVHNCGVLIVNDEITKHNSVMRTPSGELISAYELHDSESVSNLKYDLEL
ncbi:MAG: PHP domain-containing protein [Tissierellia bacterium]|nr:PHP domain-containing protein [Tissierellia bacterium]